MPAGPRPAPPPDIVRVGVTGTQGGLPWAWVFWCHTDNEIDTHAGAQDFADAFRSALNASSLVQTICHSSVVVTQIRAVIQIDDDTAVAGENTSTITGTAGGTVLPANECVVGSWQSDAYWRGGKPRTYIPGIPNTYVDTNHSLDNSTKASIVTKLAALRTDVNAITTPAVDLTTMGFVSFASGGNWRTDPLFFGFTGVTVHDRLGTQRRRLGAWLP